MSPNERVRGIINNVAPTLSEAGFSKVRPTVYVRLSGELTWLIDFQLGRGSDRHQVSLTSNCGVYVPGFMRIYTGRPEPAIPSEPDCCVHCRIPMLSEERLDKWWSVADYERSEHADEATIWELTSLIEKNALPFLHKFHTLRSVAEFLAESRERRYRPVWPVSEPLISQHLAIVLRLIGDTPRARQAMKRAIELCKIKDARIHMESILAKWDCP
jgi:hypothetical protein